MTGYISALRQKRKEIGIHKNASKVEMKQKSGGRKRMRGYFQGFENLLYTARWIQRYIPLWYLGDYHRHTY